MIMQTVSVRGANSEPQHGNVVNVSLKRPIFENDLESSTFLTLYQLNYKNKLPQFPSGH